jgi:hypothetical protein
VSRAHQCELTTSKNEADDEPRKTRDSERRRLGLPYAVTGLSSTTAASRGRDGCGGVWHPAYIALERFQERKGEDWGTDSVGDNMESDTSDGLRKEATLTRGPATSARERRERRARRALGQRLGSARDAKRGGEKGKRAARVVRGGRGRALLGYEGK